VPETRMLTQQQMEIIDVFLLESLNKKNHKIKLMADSKWHLL